MSGEDASNELMRLHEVWLQEQLSKPIDRFSAQDGGKHWRSCDEMLISLVRQAPVSIAMFDLHMRYLAVSERWLADYGMSGRNLIGQSHYAVFPEIPEHWLIAHRHGLLGDALREEEDRFERLDGSVQWVRWEVRPWRSIGSNNVEGIIRQIQPRSA